MKIKRIFVDMDGVLCNWIRGVCDLYERGLRPARGRVGRRRD